jgi:hypothetical protein
MITGMTELQKKISPKNIRNIVDKAMKNYTKKVVSDAKSNAPSVIEFNDQIDAPVQQLTNVGSTIFGSYNEGVIEIEVLDEQAPYIEFGTGIYVPQLLSQRPKEWQEIAAQFIVNKQGTLLPSPYLYPAVTDNERMIAIEIQKELND